MTMFGEKCKRNNREQIYCTLLSHALPSPDGAQLCFTHRSCSALWFTAVDAFLDGQGELCINSFLLKS